MLMSAYYEKTKRLRRRPPIGGCRSRGGYRLGGGCRLASQSHGIRQELHLVTASPKLIACAYSYVRLYLAYD